jgi:hypothetical protein
MTTMQPAPAPMPTRAHGSGEATALYMLSAEQTRQSIDRLDWLLGNVERKIQRVQTTPQPFAPHGLFPSRQWADRYDELCAAWLRLRELRSTKRAADAIAAELAA